MPIRVYWDTPARDCLLIEIASPITWDQFHECSQTGNRLIREVGQRVNVIVWVSGELPSGDVLPHLRWFLNMEPPNVDQTLIAIAAPANVEMFLRRIVSTAQRLSSRNGRVVYVPTLDEARRLSAAGRPAPV